MADPGDFAVSMRANALLQPGVTDSDRGIIAEEAELLLPIPPATMFGRMAWIAWADREVRIAKAAREAARVAKIAAKTEMFASRNAAELKAIYGWGNGLEGVQAARASLNTSVLQRIQAGISRAEVESTRDFYRAATAQGGRGGQVAVERAAYMEDILRLWK